MYISDEYIKRPGQVFKSFNELSKMTKNPNSKLLENIINEQEKYRPRKSSSRAGINPYSNADTVNLIKKQLDYNKKQERLYINKVDDYLKQLYIPLRKKEQEDKDKLSKMPRIKVIPSRKALIKASNIIC